MDAAVRAKTMRQLSDEVRVLKAHSAHRDELIAEQINLVLRELEELKSQLAEAIGNCEI